MNPLDGSHSSQVWFLQDGAERDVVLSTRLRLARNIQGYRFCSSLNYPEKQELLSSFLSAVKEEEGLKGFSAYSIDHLNVMQKGVLHERRFISGRILHYPGSGCLISQKQDVAVAVNDIEHIKICAFGGGLDIDGCYQRSRETASVLEGFCDFTRDGQGHYLTSRIADYGTGLKVTLLVQLSGLAGTGNLERILKEILQRGVSVRGIYNNHLDSVCDHYLISNECGYAVSDQEILQNMKSLLEWILEEERRARQSLLDSSQSEAADGVFQAYSQLKNSKRLELPAALEALGQLRFGIAGNLMTGIPLKILDALAILVQENHIQTLFFKESPTKDENLVNYKRADFIRTMLNQYSN